MKVHYKGITHERTEDAPFVGALICANDCKFKCKQCFNRKIKKEPTLEKDASEIIQEVLSNPLNQGIILSGLEWSLQPLEMLDLINEARLHDLQVIIYTGCELQEFHKRIGEVFKGELDMKNNMTPEEIDYVLATSGGLILDEYTPKEYYVKCGRYDNTKKVSDRVHFGVSLASSNQSIFKFVKED